MTNTEFSNEFDVIYNSITSNQAPGLNEYEKSVFLTKAQDEILEKYFNPRSNKTQEGFDDSQKRQIDFSKSIVTTTYTSDNFYPAELDTRVNSKSCDIPNDALIIINERLHVYRGEEEVDLVIVPIKFSEFDRLMSKPFKRPLNHQAWRLIIGSGTNKVDLIAGPIDEIDRYVIRYVKRPKPIILEALDERLTIRGYAGSDSNGNLVEDYTEAVNGIECELDPILHPEILQRACELAKASYTTDLSSQLALGQISLTGIGAVQTSK